MCRRRSGREAGDREVARKPGLGSSGRESGGGRVGRVGGGGVGRVGAGNREAARDPDQAQRGLGRE